MTRTTISFTRERMRYPGSRQAQGSSVSHFVREAALTRATMAADDNSYPMRTLAEQLRAIGDQGYALAEKAMTVAEEEADRKRDALQDSPATRPRLSGGNFLMGGTGLEPVTSCL